MLERSETSPVHRSSMNYGLLSLEIIFPNLSILKQKKIIKTMMMKSSLCVCGVAKERKWT